MITYVVHWVYEPELDGKGCGVPIGEMMRMFKASAGEGRFVFITDQDTPAQDDWTTIRVPRKDHSIMGHMMFARSLVCDLLEGNVVFADADTLITRDLEPLFEGRWSMSVPWYPRYLSGVMLCRDLDFAKKFFFEAHRRIEKCGRASQVFGADLSVTKDMIIEDGTGIHKDTQERICCTTPVTREGAEMWSNKGAYLLNFKGIRKLHMETVFKGLTC